MSSLYPFNPYRGQTVQSQVAGLTFTREVGAKYTITAAHAVALSHTGVHAAVTDTGSAQTGITTSITSPAVARNITATSGGTAGDIGAISVTIHGTDIAGATISEVLPVFTANSPTTVQGVKAFATVTSFDLPAHDGTGATTSIGWGDKLGIPSTLALDTVWRVWRNGAVDAAPTVVVHASNIAYNTVLPATALDGTQVDVGLFLP